MLHTAPGRVVAGLTLAAALLAAAGATPALADDTTAIEAHWLATGGASGPLGAAQGPQECGLPGGGCSQDFAGGAIYWSAATGAHILRGDIAAAVTAAGGVTGVLGLPTSEAVVVGPRGVGRVQTFQGGSVFWTAEHGARVVRGGIGAAFQAAGGVDGRLGFPTADESATATGAQQRFQGGTITWTAGTGRTAVTYR